MKFLIVLLAFLAPAWAAGPALDLPPAAPVVDEARLMSSSEDAQLDQLVRDIKARSGVEITVYIAKSLQDRSIEDFSIDVARKWGLGNKKEDRGLLLVIAPTERQMRLEVGGGLEGDVTDLFARHVLDDGLRPYFRQGRYYDGILGALQVVQEKVPLGLEASVAPTPPSQRGGGFPIRGNLIFWFIVVIFLLSRFSRLGMLGMFLGGGGGGGSWGGGGGGGGGSWGGGGGGFSGGGSSSSW